VKQNEKQLTISLHPFLHAYFTKGMISRQVKWFLKYKKWVKLETDSSLALLEYHFRNKAGGEIELS
jgi:ribonuclease G